MHGNPSLGNTTSARGQSTRGSGIIVSDRRRPAMNEKHRSLAQAEQRPIDQMGTGISQQKTGCVKFYFEGPKKTQKDPKTPKMIRVFDAKTRF
jgi:hypothetical protein